MADESEFMRFVRRELADFPSGPYGGALKVDVEKLCEVFDGQNHSGSSGRLVVHLFADLVAWRSINTKRQEPTHGN
ncbi:hypothetical protein GCM10011390_42080 [Aureimonas endophytica]|uniref:Uncharacterized protein n=1 Tax=Aureimonas endophytica TaxID=2027858 RepID=A0A917EC33_9HYPH|nr:hypothetical protein [Aureimonas endophytica]GGE18477.1 hypothetical protein GCM10011390_42080 [Aureimonas endophytica]